MGDHRSLFVEFCRRKDIRRQNPCRMFFHQRTVEEKRLLFPQENRQKNSPVFGIRQGRDRLCSHFQVRRQRGIKEKISRSGSDCCSENSCSENSADCCSENSACYCSGYCSCEFTSFAPIVCTVFAADIPPIRLRKKLQIFLIFLLTTATPKVIIKS